MAAGDQYDDTINAAAKEWDVDPTLLKSVMLQESGGNAGAISRAGARGLMQIMPATGRMLGMTDIDDPVQSIYAGAKYLSMGLDAEGSPDKALLYYHGGPDWRQSYGRESAGYVPGVAAHYRALSAQQPAATPATTDDSGAAKPVRVAQAGTGTATDATPAPAAGDAQPAQPDPAKMNDADWLDWMSQKYPSLKGPNAQATPATPATPATQGKKVTDDDFLKSTGAATPGSSSATPGGSSATPGSNGAKPGVPSDADFLQSTGGAPTETVAAPGEKKKELIGQYSRAGGAKAAEESIPTPGPRALPQAPAQPTEPTAGPSEDKGPLQNILAAGTQAYQESPPLLTPEARKAVDESGWFGRYVGNPLLDFGGAVLGTGAALGADISQGAYELGRAVGGPSLGREFYVGSQTVPAVMTGMPAGIRLPGAVGRTAEAPRPVTEPTLPGVAEVSPEAQVRMAGNPKGPSEPIPPEGAAPSAAGAQGTPYSAVPPQTPTERIANLEKSVVQTAEDRAGPQMQDDTRYVPNIPDRTLAAQDFDSQNALDEKARMAANPEFKNKVDAINRERNQGMVDLLAGDAKDANALEAAHETRQLVSPDEMGVFDKEQPVDASGNLAALDQVLESRAGKRDAVRAVLEKVRKSFFDADGNLETSPSQLYGVRQNITDLLKKGVKGTSDEADAVRASKSILTGMLGPLDETITKGAPDFQRYLQAWHELSKPIDRMEFLQKYQTGAKKLTGVDGYLQLGKVQKMLDDVLQGNKARGPNGAKNLTDQEIGNVINVRNELAAQSLKDRLASTRGSDSFQQFNRAGKFAGPVGTALRMTGILGTGGAANLLYEHAIRPGMERSRERRIARLTTARENALLGGIPK